LVSLRIAALGLVASLAAHAALGESHRLSAKQTTLLSSVRQHALAYISTLPNFICTQVTQRDSKQSGTALSADDGIANPIYGPSDTVVEKLSFFHQKEHYQLISINGRPATGAELKRAAGAASSGDFGTALRVIFLPRTGTQFSFHHDTHLRGRRVFDIEFHVPKSAGTPILDRNSRKAVIVSYQGHIYVDAETLDILRYTTQFDLPGNFAIQSAYRIVDYGQVTIEGKLYSLPSHAEVTMESGPFSFVNKIDFTSYHEYKVQATIRYGTADLLPAPSSAPSAQQAEAPAKAPTEAQSEPPTSVTAQPAATQPAAAPPSPTTAAPASQPQPTAEAVSPPQSLATATASSTTPAPPPAVSQFGFKVASDLVLVPVIVLDADGHAVTNLTRDDFQLFDKGKRQQITDFTVETSREQPGVASSASSAPSPSAPPPATFLVYFFDDLHLNDEELIRARNAVLQQLATIRPSYHVAILSTSGLVQQTFTPDQQKLRQALAKLHAQPLGDPARGRCPDFGAYTAQTLEDQGSLDGHGPSAGPLNALIAETMACKGISPQTAGAELIAKQTLVQTARDLLRQSGQQSRQALLQLRDVIHWIAPAPGRKVVVLISRGFLLNDTSRFDISDLLDDAVRHEVIISSLNARGVYAQDPSGNIEQPGYDPEMTAITHSLDAQEVVAQDGTLGTIAYGTGGLFFHNNNDLFAGLQRLAAPPACTYLLAFKPEHLKLNGSLHPLTVKLRNGKQWTVQARRGYFATKPK